MEQLVRLIFVRWELIGVISKHHLDCSNYGVYINEIFLPLGGPSIDSNTYMLFQDYFISYTECKSNIFYRVLILACPFSAMTKDISPIPEIAKCKCLI